MITKQKYWPKSGMSLCQYYDYVSTLCGWSSWNSYCASSTLHERERSKKFLKRVYKQLAVSNDGSNQPEGGSDNNVGNDDRNDS